MEYGVYEIVERPAYRAMGLKWEGSFEEIVDLRAVIAEVKSRAGELKAVEPDMQLGLSYHTRPDGFTHYSVYEVEGDQELPEGMIEIEIPAMTYLATHHKKGEEIGVTYEKIHQWLAENHYKPYADEAVNYFENDELPIKHECYPADRDEEDAHFDILIPVEKIS